MKFIITAIYVYLVSMKFNIFYKSKLSSEEYIYASLRIFHYKNNVYTVIKDALKKDKSIISVFKNGTLLWTKNLPNSTLSFYDGIDLSSDGKLFVGDKKGLLYIFDIITGERKGLIKTNERIDAVKVIETNKDTYKLLLIKNEYKTLEIVNITDSTIVEKVYRKEIKGFTDKVFPSFPVIDGSKLYFTEKNKVFCVNYIIRKKEWALDLGSKSGLFLFFFSAPNIIFPMKEYNKNFLIVGTVFGDLFKISKKGEIVSKISLGKSHLLTDMSFFDFNKDGVKDILCTSATGYIWIIDGRRFSIISKIKTNAPIFKAPGIADLDEDGNFEIINLNKEGKVSVMDYKKNILKEINIGDTFGEDANIIVEDIDNDGVSELLTLSSSLRGIIYIADLNNSASVPFINNEK